MVLNTAIFSAVRALEVLVSIPILGILAWFVDPYVKNKSHVPDNLLTLFIVSVLAAAWALVTLYQFKKTRGVSGPAIALIDLAFVGALLAGIIMLRGIAKADCGNLTVPLGVTIGDKNYSGGSNLSYRLSKPCALMKAAWILAIVDAALFLITAFLSWSMYRSYKNGTRTTHSKDYAGRRSGSTSTYTSHRHRHHRTSHV